MLFSLLETGSRMLFLLLAALAIHPAALLGARPTPPAPGLGEGFWHTRGNQLLDAANRPVRIAGVNWYGFETTQSAPGGLEVQDYKVILQTIKRDGYNAIRIPFSNQMVETPIVPPASSSAVQFSNPSGPINTDLKGLDSLQILDRIVAYAGSQGLKVILDNHRSEAGAGAELNGLWFTQAYPERAWIADWQMLARRYANDPTVLGLDLRNEPHSANSGGACWGCGGANDWRLAAERAGNAVLAINPHLLIFVEGVDAYENDSYWWGGNLMGVHTAPIRLSVPHQLVYSAHDYGPAESGQSWFTPQMSASSLNAVWTQHWAFISQQNIAPVWLGEFGLETPKSAPPTVAEDLESEWFESLLQFLSKEKHIGWTYWALNGSDRYGLLNSNYDAIRSFTLQNALVTIQSPLGIGAGPGPGTAAPAPDGHPPYNRRARMYRSTAAGSSSRQASPSTSRCRRSVAETSSCTLFNTWTRASWSSVSPNGERSSSENPGRLTTIHSAKSSSRSGSCHRRSPRKLSAPTSTNRVAPGISQPSAATVSTV